MTKKRDKARRAEKIVSKYILINSSSVRMPRAFINKWCNEIYSYLRKKKIKSHLYQNQIVTIVFLDLSSAKSINLKYRKKNYATDILSFEGDGVEALGELVLCPQVLKKQAQEHSLSFSEELGYMLIHGILHLLGYDHEKNQREAKIMFQLQDDMFEYLSRRFWS